MHILETTDLKKYYGTEPNLTRALEDLQVIRTVLDKASPSFQTLAASFRVLGILWLVPAGLLAFLQGESQISYLFALDHGIALYAGPNLLLLLQGAIVLLAAVFCLLWQGKKRRGAFSPEEAKVVTLWQVLLLLFLVCTVAGMVGTFSSAVQEAMFSPDSLDGYRTFYVCGALQTFAPVLFPSLPLLITGSMGKDRVLWILGLVCLLLGVWGMLQFFFPYASFLLLFNLPLTLWQTLQGPIALLVTARRLRMKGA